VSAENNAWKLKGSSWWEETVCESSLLLLSPVLSCVVFLQRHLREELVYIMQVATTPKTAEVKVTHARSCFIEKNIRLTKVILLLLSRLLTPCFFIVPFIMSRLASRHYAVSDLSE
jgi:hypothetical protein